jgi:hypothetical protein
MRVAVIAVLALTACTSGGGNESETNGVLPQAPQTNISEVTAATLPPALTAVVQEAVPGMQVVEAERKEREGRIYYDIEGKRPDGSEVELDILQEGEGFRLVEIQRDLAWAAVPANVQAAVRAKPDAFTPERVIESTQPDGSVIFELFAPGKPTDPAMEVRVKDGKAEVLTTRSAD